MTESSYKNFREQYEGTMEFTQEELKKISRECINCGLCLMVCPILSVKKKTKFQGPRSVAGSISRSPDFLDAKDVIYYCTCCGKCSKVCAKNIPTDEIVMLIRSKIYERDKDALPAPMKRVLENIIKHGRVYDEEKK